MTPAYSKLSKLSIEFGALSDTLLRQLRRQGLEPINAHAEGLIEHLDDQCHSLVRLRIGGLISAGEVDAARKRVLRQLRPLVRPRAEMPQ